MITYELLFGWHVPEHPLPDHGRYIWAKVWSVDEQKEHANLGIYDMLEERVGLTNVSLDRVRRETTG